MDNNKNTENLKRPCAVKRALGYIKEYGLGTTVFLFKDRLKSLKKGTPYDIFIKNREKDIMETEELDYRPLFSFVVPVYNVLGNQLEECIESILNQTYDNFELVLVDDKSTWKSVPKILEKYKNHPKVTVIYREENGHISRCTNTGIDAASGEYIVFTDCDDIVAPNTVYEFTKVVNKDRDIDFIYSDEDKLSDDGKKRSFPFFKPDWSPDTLMSLMYTSHISAYRTSLVRELGGLRVGFEGSQDYDLTLRFTEKTQRIAHIPKVLYHWRERPESTAVSIDAKPYIIEVIRKLKTEALERRGLKGNVVFIPEIAQFGVEYDVPENKPLVSVIIPSKDNYEIIERCLRSLCEKTEYKNYELIVVDNGSSPENKKLYTELCGKYNALYHYEKMSFNFSKMCNRGASLAKGEYLLFLNDDIEIIDGKWLSLMLGQAALSHAGAVGAKLLYPNSSLIQHCGVINLPVGPCHVFSHMSDSVNYPFCRNRLTFNYIAVTAACLLVKSEKFHKVEGFDEKLEVNYNDVDLCFKLYENGWYNSIRNDAVLYHHESISRGVDTQSTEKMRKLYAALDRLFEKHPQFKDRDPFYNENLIKNNINFDIDVSMPPSFSPIRGREPVPQKHFDDRVKAYVDNISCSDVIDITGWAFIAAMPFNNFNKKTVILSDDKGETVTISAETRFRHDVSCAFGGRKGINLSGFHCSIPISELKKGRYRVGILLENPITLKRLGAMLDEYVEV